MKKVLYILVALVAIYLVLCLVGPADTRVERTGVINAPASAVQATLADFNAFPKWSPWKEYDPSMKTTVEGEPGKPGHKYSWEGNKEVGKGTMVLEGIRGDSLLQTLDMGYGPSQVYMVTKEASGATNLTWGFYSKTPFLFRPMGLFMDMDKMMGPDFEKGIANLKTLVESNVAAAAPKYEVKELIWESERTYYGNKTANLAMDRVAGMLGENFPMIYADMEKNKVTPESAPSCLVYSWNDSTMSGDMAAAFAAPKDAKLKGWVKHTVPAGKVLMVEYYGSPDNTYPAHEAVVNYLKERNLSHGLVIEEFVTDPGKEPDTSKWLTNIYYIVKQ